MKITTQRMLLWLGNFVLAAGLIGLVIVFDKTASPKARNKMVKTTLKDFKDSLRGVKAQRGSSATAEATGSKIDAVFDKDFHYMGYVAPPPPVDPVKPVTRAARAPDLSGLVEVIFLIAPDRASMASGPSFIDDTGKAVIKLKELNGAQTIFTYAEGDIIGIGERADRPDTEPGKFVKWGGARIVRIEPDQLVCKWQKTDGKEGADQVVSMVSRDVASIGPDGKLNLGEAGSGAASSGKSGPTVASAEGPMFKVEDKGIRTNATLTKAGWQQLNQRGSEIMDGISFEKGKDLNGRDALKVKSMPAPLREYGLRDGDVIVRIDSVFTTSKESIARYVKKTYRTKSSYNVQVLREGKMRILRVNVPRDVKKIPNSRASSAGQRTRNRIGGRRR